MRQYAILYRRGKLDDAGQFVRLKSEHANLFNRDEVKLAIDFMRDNASVEAMYIRLDDEFFQVVAFTQDAEAPNAFKF